MSGFGNLLTAVANNTSQSAIGAYVNSITGNTDALSQPSKIAKERMDTYLFDATKSKALNGYNSVLTYVAIETILAVLEQTNITCSVTSNGAATKIAAKLGATEVDSLTINGTAVTATATELNKLDGVTATTDDLNILSGVNATATELNYLDGASSSTYTENKVALYDSNGHLVLNPSNDSSLSNNNAVTKSYVDSLAQGLHVKDAVRVATTTSGTLSSDFANGKSIDGITLATGDRILIKNQTTGSENGIYTANATGAPTRALDFNHDSDIENGAFTFVKEGNTNSDAGFVCTNDGTISIGTTDLTFTQFSGAGSVQISEGTGVTVATSGSQHTFSIGQSVGTTDNVTFGQLTTTGQLTANGGIVCDTNKFTVADTTGNTSIGGTLDVTGDTSVSTFDSSGATSLATGGGVVNIASTGVMTTVKGTLNVDEAVTLDSTLDVTGETTLSGALDLNNTADISDTLTLSKETGTGLSVTSDATVGGSLGVTGQLTAPDLTYGTPLNKNQSIEYGDNNTAYTNVSACIYDLLAKIRAQDQTITLLLQNIDVSSSLSSSNPFYAGANYTGTNSITNDESLNYT